MSGVIGGSGLLEMSQQQYYEYCRQANYFNQQTLTNPNGMQQETQQKVLEEALLLINDEEGE